jgi:F-type H+-transporting ATPase subunit b
LLAVLAVSATRLAWAVDPAGPEERHAPEAGHSAHGDHKAEQVDIFTKALDLGIWTVVVFLVLLFVLGKYAWKPMLEGLRKREENIHNALEEAKRARDEAQTAREQFQRELDRAHQTVREILDEARRDAQHTKEEIVAQARGEIQTERDRLRREIETARDQALQELWNQTAQLATLVSAKAIRRELSPEDHGRLIDEALAELNQAGSEWQRQVAGVRT